MQALITHVGTGRAADTIPYLVLLYLVKDFLNNRWYRVSIVDLIVEVIEFAEHSFYSFLNFWGSFVESIGKSIKPYVKK